MFSLRSAADEQALETYVVGDTITGQHDDLGFVAALCVERAAQSGRCGRTRLQRRLVDRDTQGTVGLWPGDDGHARGRDHRHRIRADHRQQVAHRQGLDTAGTGGMA